jgi:hypothetical protein
MIKKLTYTMLFPVEGDSSILEVSGEGVGEFMHVALSLDRRLEFTFYDKQEMVLSQDQFEEICRIARKNLTLAEL